MQSPYKAKTELKFAFPSRENKYLIPKKGNEELKTFYNKYFSLNNHIAIIHNERGYHENNDLRSNYNTFLKIIKSRYYTAIKRNTPIEIIGTFQAKDRLGINHYFNYTITPPNYQQGVIRGSSLTKHKYAVIIIHAELIPAYLAKKIDLKTKYTMHSLYTVLMSTYPENLENRKNPPAYIKDIKTLQSQLISQESPEKNLQQALKIRNNMEKPHTHKQSILRNPQSKVGQSRFGRAQETIAYNETKCDCHNNKPTRAEAFLEEIPETVIPENLRLI